MLLNSGEASSTAQSTHQIQQDLLELLLALIKRLRELADRQHKPQDKAAADPDGPSIDNLAAEAVKNLVRQQGAVEPTPEGDQHVYRSGPFTLSANLNDGTGYPVYTVTCAERGELFQFQDHPTQTGEFIFYDTEHVLDAAEKLDLFSRLKDTLEARIKEQEQSRSTLAAALEQEPDPAAAPAAKALDAQIDMQAQIAKQDRDGAVGKAQVAIAALGQPPEPAQAASVAVAVLGSAEFYEGKHYSIRRTEAGTVELYAGRLPAPGQQANPLLVIDPKGQVSCTSAFTDRHAAQFSAMHTRLHQATQFRHTKPQQGQSGPPSRQPGREGR